MRHISRPERGQAGAGKSGPQPATPGIIRPLMRMLMRMMDMNGKRAIEMNGIPLRGAAAALLLASTLVLAAACDDKHAAEKTGEAVGRSVDQVAEKVGAAGKQSTQAGGPAPANARQWIEGKAHAAKEDA